MGGWVLVVLCSICLDWMGLISLVFYAIPFSSLHVATTLTMLFYYVVILSLFWIIVEVGGAGG